MLYLLWEWSGIEVAQDAAVYNSPERRNVQGGSIITTVGFSIRAELAQKLWNQHPNKKASARDMYKHANIPGDLNTIAKSQNKSSEFNLRGEGEFDV